MKHHIRSISTEKAKSNLDFIHGRLDKADNELQEAEEMLAAFMDSNQAPQTARLQTQVEKLQRVVRFKEQLFLDLQTQLVLAEIDLQKRNPVFTLIEAPVPALQKSGPRRKLMVIFGFLFGLGLSTAWVVGGHYMGEAKKNSDSGPILQEIQDTFPSLSVRGRFSPLNILRRRH